MSISSSFFAFFSGVPRLASGSDGALKDSGWLWLGGAISGTGAKGEKMSEIRTEIKLF